MRLVLTPQTLRCSYNVICRFEEWKPRELWLSREHLDSWGSTRRGDWRRYGSCGHRWTAFDWSSSWAASLQNAPLVLPGWTKKGLRRANLREQSEGWNRLPRSKWTAEQGTRPVAASANQLTIETAAILNHKETQALAASSRRFPFGRAG